MNICSTAQPVRMMSDASGKLLKRPEMKRPEKPDGRKLFNDGTQTDQGGETQKVETPDASSIR